MPLARARRAVSVSWAVAVVAMVALIWGNSLVPGEGSSEVSLGVLAAAREFLASLGLPAGWLTNFLVRKTAHFTEYAVLGTLATRAAWPSLARTRRAWLPLAVFLAAIPSLDETIQLFVPARAGMVTDVLLDCCGAATGVFLCRLAGRAWERRRACGKNSRN